MASPGTTVAFLPSPGPGTWHLGLLPVRGYALCIVLGILVAVRVASRRYVRLGGHPGVILDVATWAVPAGLVGARLYSVVTDYELYFRPGRDWIDIFRVWDGGIGMPGAVVAGVLGAWLGCRRAGVRFGPVAGAAAPAVAFGQAIGRWGNWFNQELYGRPSSLPWAVEIDPAHRVIPYENYATFQPAFLYESLWDLLLGLALIWAARRFRLTGDRVLALYAAGYATGSFAVQSLRDRLRAPPVRPADGPVGDDRHLDRRRQLPDHDGRQAGAGHHHHGGPATIPRTAGVCRSRGPGTSRGQSSRSGCSQRVRCFANRTKRG